MHTHFPECGLERPGTGPARVVHLYPLDRCNLACCHCYASSSRQKQTILPLAPLLQALPRLRAEGYEVISLSGGEPLLYPQLATLLAAAKAEGFRTAATTNGFRVTARHRATIEAIDSFAVSFDGMGALHNRIRGNLAAWDAAISALRFLAGIGKPVTAAYTVSKASLEDIPDFIELCASISVRSVRLRPLAMAGRAPLRVADLAPDEADLSRLWQVAQEQARIWKDVVNVRVDLALANGIAESPEAWELVSQDEAGKGLSEVVDPLVITPKGVLRPYAYDFPGEFDLGLLQDLAPERRVWIAGGLPRLRRLLARTLHAAALQDGIVDWYSFRRDQARPHASLPA